MQKIKSHSARVDNPPKENVVDKTEPACIQSAQLPLIYCLKEHDSNTFDIAHIYIGCCQSPNDYIYICHEWRKEHNKAVDLSIIYQSETDGAYVSLFDIKKTIGNYHVFVKLLNQYYENYYYAVEQCNSVGIDIRKIDFGVFTENWNTALFKNKVDELIAYIKKNKPITGLPLAQKHQVSITQKEKELNSLVQFFEYKKIEIDGNIFPISVLFLHKPVVEKGPAEIKVSFGINGLSEITS